VVDHTKLAAVFDAMADYVDQVETEKTSSVAAARQVRLDKIATAHATAHGEELPDIARQKLAKADDATLDVVEDLLSKQAGIVTPLGGGVSADDDLQPKTTKQAADAADERFVSWIVSS
jgi:hypothetical protein